MLSPSWKDDLIPLVGPFDASQLFDLQLLAMPCWLLLMLAPRWKHTHTICWIPILLHAVIYTISAVSIMADPNQRPADVSFDSLECILKLFSNPNVAYAGWAHYICHDLFVGRALSLDALQHTSGYLEYVLLMVPILFFALMGGPVSLVMYAFVKLCVFKNRLPPTKEKAV